MIRPLKTAVALLLLACACRTVPASTVQDPSEARPQERDVRVNLPVEDLLLDNGMRVLIVRKPGVPRVFCSLWWKVGSVHERPGLTGIAHFFEHMMFKGTRTIGTRDPDRDHEINEEIEATMDKVRAIEYRRLELERRGESLSPEDEAAVEALHARYRGLVEEQKGITISEHLSKLFQAHGGTGLNASTSFDRTNYYVELPSNKVELFFWLEADRFLRPVFREFYPERDVVMEERRERTDSTPTGLIDESYWASMWDAHPYSWPVIGWPSDIRNYRLRDAEAFYARHYSPQNCVAIFVGDLDPERIKSLSRRYFGRMKRFGEDVDPVWTEELEQSAEKRMVAEAQAQHRFTSRWRGPSQVHRDAAVLDVLMSGLEGRTGRLYRRLVVEKRLALHTSAWYWGLRHGGILNVTAVPRIGPKPPEMSAEEYRRNADSAFAELEAALFEVLEEVKRDGLSDRELRKVKNKLLADTIRRFESLEDIGNELGYWETIGEWKDMNRWLEGVQAVTNEDVRRAARRYLTARGRNIQVIHRAADAGEAEEDDE